MLLSIDGIVAGVGDVTADDEGGWRFLALLDPARLHDGDHRVSLLVPNAAGGFDRATSAHTGRPALGRDVLTLDGVDRPLVPPDGDERLEVARAVTDGASITVEGLAVSGGATPPEEIVLFVGDRPVSAGPDESVLREGGDALERWGFVLQVPVEVIDADAGVIRFEDEGQVIEQSILGGRAKLQWKVDWAMRWVDLGVDYEMCGKDLTDSVTIGGKIAAILGGRRPEGLIY
ncbi:MAG TPA: hypothetical protein PKA98_23645, partial [Acidimicrobiales bacterium]|nr:hypothetical protein [Acidimicrobiales bacterium]